MPCRRSSVSFASWNGVSKRLVNSSPSIGAILMVGFSATLPPMTGRIVRLASPVRAGVAPAVKRKSKVAATLETPVK